MSKLYSKNLVAVTVDHVIINRDEMAPIRVCRSVNKDINAKKMKGINE